MKRVLSLLPSTTEIIYAIGAEQALVAVTHECDYPPAARSKPRVTAARIDPSMGSAAIDELVQAQLEESGSLYTLDMELVRSLAPEIVLTQQLCTVCAVGYETVRHAMSTLVSPPQVINVEPHTLDDVFTSFATIGRLLDRNDQAEELVSACRAELAAIRPALRAPRVLFLEWLIPPFSAGHWIPELIEAAGAMPLLHNSGGYSRRLDRAEIETVECDFIVISCCGFDIARALQDVESCTELHRIVAARPHAEVYLFDGNHFFSRPGPRLIESAMLLGAALRGVDATKLESSTETPFRNITSLVRNQLQSAS